jgi:4-amino-4-deoxy-L-arabinose transferase-like glycosyltransferase
LSRVATAVFGDTVWAMRIPAVFAIAVAIVLAALTTRELGGGRTAQTLSAWGFGFAALPLITGHLFITATLDFALWAAVLLCVTRALLRQAPRYWLVAGAMVGISLYNKRRSPCCWSVSPLAPPPWSAGCSVGLGCGVASVPCLSGCPT